METPIYHFDWTKQEMEVIAQSLALKLPLKVIPLPGNSACCCPGCRMVLQEEQAAFCSRCGQALDWAKD